MKKSSKKIPKSHLPKFSPGGTTSQFSDEVQYNSMYTSGMGDRYATNNSGNSTSNIYDDSRASKIKNQEQAQQTGQYVAAASAGVDGGINMMNTYKDPNATIAQGWNAGADTGANVVGSFGPWGQVLGMGIKATNKGGNALREGFFEKQNADGTLKHPRLAEAAAFTNTVANPLTWGSMINKGIYTPRQYRDTVEKENKDRIAQENAMFAFGGMNMQPNAEIELTEGTNNAGSIREHDLPSHENATSKNQKYLPPATRILSTRLKNPLTGKPFSDETVNTKKAEKTLNDPNASPIAKKRANLDVLAANILFDRSYAVQEALKQAKVEAYAKKMGVTLPQAQEAPEEGMQFPMGGVKLPMYPLGGPTDNTKFTPGQRQQAYADSMTLYKSGFNKNIPNWQAEPGFNEAALRLNKLNGTPPESTDKSPIASDYNYLQNRSVPYAKPTFPGVQYKKEVSPLKQSYPMERLPLKDLNNPVDINPQFQSVPTNRPNTIKTQIQTGPNMSYKEYKQGNEVMDRMYFKPGTEEEIEVTGFKYGGKMLPKFWTGGKMVNGTWVPDNYDIITAHNATNSYKPGTIGYYDSMNSPDKPSNDSLQSSYGPDVLPWNRSNDSGNSTAYDNTVNPQQFQEVTSNSKSNIGSPKVTDPNDKNFDWGKLKTVGQNYGNFALQNAGNIYDLTRKKDPLQKYDRATAKFLDPSSAIRDALAQTRRAEYNVRGASGGNAGTYLSNRVALNAQNTENLARIHQNYQNANAQISNQNSQFNTEIAYREAEAQAKDRAMRQNVDSQAIHSMASNFGKMSKSSKQDNMEQKELDMFMYRYKNEPGFKEQVDKFRTT